MDRRRFLATSAVITGASIGGCTRLAGEIPLGDPAAELDSRQLNLVYEKDGVEIVTVSFTHSRDTPAIRRLHVGVDNADQTTLQEVRFRFRPEIADPAAIEFYLMPPPRGWYDEFEIYRENGWTGIEVAELGDARFGNTGFHLLVHGEFDGDGDLPPLRVEHDLALSAEGLFGETYRVDGGTLLDLDRLQAPHNE